MRLVLDPNVVVSAVVADVAPAGSLSRDPDDDYLVALAQRENAKALVSGDSDLTALKQNDPPVLTPAQALTHLDEAGR